MPKMGRDLLKSAVLKDRAVPDAGMAESYPFLYFKYEKDSVAGLEARLWNDNYFMKKL